MARVLRSRAGGRRPRRSVVSAVTNRGGSGALNPFSTEPYAVDADSEAIGAMLATHAAGVMMAVNRRQEVESALASRDFIGQAKASS